MNTKITLAKLILTVFIAVTILAIGLTVGLNTNKISYIEASTYHSPEIHHEQTESGGQLQFSKLPVTIYYSQGDDTGDEVDVRTGVFAATGVLVNASRLTPSGGNKEVAVGFGFTPLRFQAFIGKQKSHTYLSLLTVTHPDGGSIQMEDGDPTSISGSPAVQEELKKAAKEILKHL